MIKLATEYLDKPWGRCALPAAFKERDFRVGEVHFRHPQEAELPLLVKYIFTSERLSVQVHPNDEQARRRGLNHGKTECWYIVDAEPGASVALGFKEEISSDQIRSAALDGTIEKLLDWVPAQAGDFFFVPAGTVHAIGPGLTLVEVQQNSDTTYRLYDYGRPRELHLDDAVDVARTGPRSADHAKRVVPDESALLVGGEHFHLAHWVGEGIVDTFQSKDRWVIPLEGEVAAGGDVGRPSECLLVPATEELRASKGARLLIAST
jgi:mannose-6-phosphate isomerase